MPPAPGADVGLELGTILSPLPGDDAETVPPDEHIDMQRVLDDIDTLVRERFAQVEAGTKEASPSGARAVRDAHPKILGCCKATLEVRADLPAHLAHGVLQPRARYAAWVRFSNGNREIQSDREPDGRGMAIKLCRLPPALGPRLPALAIDEEATQDLVMIDHPVFFVRDARDYVAFARRERDHRSQIPFFLGALARLRGFLHAMRIRKQPASVLDQRFFSMTPYRLGPQVVKMSMRPLRAAPAPAPASGSDAPEALRTALRQQLAAEEARFALEVQLRQPRMSIEDATRQWDEDDAPFEAVAELVIPVQVPDSPERLAFGDRLSFSPWHGLVAHRPLGSLNRLRRVVYAAIAHLRRDLDGKPGTFEPRGDEP